MESPSTEELERLLAWVPFLEPLSEDERGWLALRLTFTTLEAGETFVVGPEEHAQRMVLVLRGQLQVYEKDPSDRGAYPCGARGRRIRWADGSGAPYSAGAARAGPGAGTALLPGAGRPREAGSQQPGGGARPGAAVGREARGDGGQVGRCGRQGGFGPAGEQLLLLIESEGVVTPEGYRIPIRYTHQQVASMIGTNRESTTKAFGRLQEQGGVELKERYVYVTDVDALKRASG